MVPKGMELGAWGRISKRSNDLMKQHHWQWTRILKRKALWSGSSSAGGLIRIMRGSKYLKRDNGANKDAKDEEPEQNKEEYHDKAVNHQEEFANLFSYATRHKVIFNF